MTASTHPAAQSFEPDDIGDLDERSGTGRGRRGHKLNGASDASRFRLVPFGQIAANVERRYVVKGLIPRQGLIAVWGPPKSGKSFWCSTVALHIALGWEYRGRKVEAGPVIYLACEGGFGFGTRIEAFRQRFLADDDVTAPFFLMAERLDLIGDHQALVARMREQLADVVPVAVFLDTLNRSFRGSELSDEDMSAYLDAGSAIGEAFGCAVVIVHHCGVDGTRPRGHTSLTGAVDAQLAVKREGEPGTFTVTVEYMKDGPEGDVIASRLEAVEIATDADGDPVTSCVVVEADAPDRASGKKKLSPKMRRALDCLTTLIADHGEPAPDAAHYPPGSRIVSLDHWRDAMLARDVLDKDGKNPRTDYKRLRDSMAERGAIGIYDGRVWAISSTPEGTQQ